VRNQEAIAQYADSSFHPHTVKLSAKDSRNLQELSLN
jgi:hypothetical protein